jgi:hypothetical protein
MSGANDEDLEIYSSSCGRSADMDAKGSKNIILSATKR